MKPAAGAIVAGALITGPGCEFNAAAFGIGVTFRWWNWRGKTSAIRQRRHVESKIKVVLGLTGNINIFPVVGEGTDIDANPPCLSEDKSYILAETTFPFDNAAILTNGIL